MSWKIKKIGEVLNFKRGYDLPSSVRNLGDIPVISSAGISDFHDDYKKEGEGIITGRYGTLGEIYYINGKYWPLNTTLYITDFKGNDAKFMYYFLKTIHLERFNGAAAVPGLDRNVIHKVEVLFNEDTIVQKKIACILSSYDELIENNKQRIQLLEEMAEEIYKEWFVRLRFPGYETAKIVDGLPEGWEEDIISKYFTTSSGGTPSRTKEEYYKNGTINWLKTKELLDTFIFSSEEKITEVALKKSSAKIFPKDTILIGMYGGVHGEGRKSTLGQLGILCESSSTNQASCAFLPKNKIYSYPYLFLYLKSKRVDFLNKSMGAAQQNISQDIIKNSSYIQPNENLLKIFDELIKPFFKEIKILSQKNQLLQETRDLLLPRLISGKLSVSHLVEEELGMVAEEREEYKNTNHH